MGHPYHHALSSVRKWGGAADDYLPLHQWFDESKVVIADFRHRALRHHAEGIFMLERFFGATIAISTGRVVPVRLIGERHVIEDLGLIPGFADWVRPNPGWAGLSQSTVRSIRLRRPPDHFFTPTFDQPGRCAGLSHFWGLTWPTICPPF